MNTTSTRFTTIRPFTPFKPMNTCFRWKKNYDEIELRQNIDLLEFSIVDIVVEGDFVCDLSTFTEIGD